MIISMETYRRGRGIPGMSPNETREQIAARLAHPMFKRWQLLQRRPDALANVWQRDFWAFAAAVSPQPSGSLKLRRLDQANPMGPGNWEWSKTPTAEDTRAYMKAYRQDRERELRGARIQRQYGVSIDVYESMLAAQDGVCAICKQAEARFVRRGHGRTSFLCVDHDHETGAVRALLCGRCNVGIGSFNDDEETVLAAAAYLRRFKRAAAA